MRVVVAGAGIAGLEALAGLHALAGERVELTLLAPVDSFAYRPLSATTPFAFGDERSLPLRTLAADLGATWVQEGLAYVDQDRSRVLTRSGDFIPYDRLILAMGAHRGPGAAEAVTWRRGLEGPRLFGRLLRDLELGEARSAAFIVPPVAGWPVDAYELSLIAARAAPAARVVLVTAEQAPLEALGGEASEAVRGELADAGVELRTGAEVHEPPPAADEAGADAFSAVISHMKRPGPPSRGGRQISVRLGAGESLSVDRAMSLPVCRGPAIEGVAHDPHGFVGIDGEARVLGSDRLFAAGDATAVQLKHSVVAAAQAGAAAEAIAAEAGVTLTPEPWHGAVYGIIAVPPHFPGAGNDVWLSGDEPVTHCLWWPPGHVTGRHLAPYVAARDPVVATGLRFHPAGLAVTAVVTGELPVPPVPPRPARPGALERDAVARQLLAIRRTGRASERLQRLLEQRGEEFERHEQEVIARLEQAGYLRHAPRGR